MPSSSRSTSYRTRILLSLGAAFAMLYLILGDRILFGFVGTLELDAALRAALVTRYDPGSIVPLTMVEIDDVTAAPPTETSESWGFSDVTPRDKLAQMLGVIAASAPSAIVVDIDLSDDVAAGAKAEAQGDAQLTSLLRDYAGPPLIWVKRADMTADGQIRIAASRLYDPIVAANPKLSWAHAMYATDADGTVRRWAEWLVQCSASPFNALPSVPLRVLSVWPTGAPIQYLRPPAYSFRKPCRSGLSDSRNHIVIYDEALTGRHDAAVSRNLSRVSAWQLLDQKIKRDDHALFSGRAILVGGTRTGTTDLWRTAVGLLPGVELMANTVRFAPGQLRESSHTVAYSLLLFLAFCALQLLLRPIVAIAVGIGMCGAMLQVLGPYAMADAIKNAIILFLEMSLVEEAMHLGLDVRKYGWRFFVASDLRAPHS